MGCIRPRMLLARPSRVFQVAPAQAESRILGSEVRGKPREGRKKSRSPRGVGLRRARRLGMRDFVTASATGEAREVPAVCRNLRLTSGSPSMEQLSDTDRSHRSSLEDSDRKLRDRKSLALDAAYLRRRRRRPVSKSAPKIRGADLFCGCGGLSIGLREACCDLGFRFESVWAVDVDSRALSVYRDNFSPAHRSTEPIENLFPKNFGEDPVASERELKKQLGSLDVALAGPPCQGHSGLNNWTRHDDERNRLYLKVGRFAEIVGPTHFLIENVPSVVADKDRSIHRAVDQLKELGYFVDFEVIDLSRIGVPQRRKRHIVVASKIKEPDIASWINQYEVEPRSVWWAIGDLEQVTENGLLNTPARLSSENIRRIDHLFEYNEFDLPNALRPDCHQDGDHSYISMYGRLKKDYPAQTITTGFGSPGQGRFIHPSRRRTLTPREAARLQFIPDNFRFSSAEYRSVLANLIGNAVPPKLSWILFRELLK